jgi:hypothetical protein
MFGKFAVICAVVLLSGSAFGYPGYQHDHDYYVSEEPEILVNYKM